MAFREKTAYEEIRPHPFITQCYGFFQDELSLYLLLELCVMDLFELLQLHADHKGRLSQPNPNPIPNPIPNPNPNPNPIPNPRYTKVVSQA